MGVPTPRDGGDQDIPDEPSFQSWDRASTNMDNSFGARRFHHRPGSKHKLSRPSLWPRSGISL